MANSYIDAGGQKVNATSHIVGAQTVLTQRGQIVHVAPFSQALSAAVAPQATVNLDFDAIADGKTAKLHLILVHSFAPVRWTLFTLNNGVPTEHFSFGTNPSRPTIPIDLRGLFSLAGAATPQKFRLRAVNLEPVGGFSDTAYAWLAWDNDDTV